MYIRFLFLILALSALLASCENQQRKNSTAKPSIADTIHRIDTLDKDVIEVSIPHSRYKEWDSFWLAFIKSAANKDTAGIESLTHFPFYQNEGEINPTEFVSLWVGQTFNITTRMEAVLSDTFLLPSLTGRPSLHEQIDSLRYLYTNGCDFYFARIDSVYQLLTIKTPG